jgi:hypothetical protein
MSSAPPWQGEVGDPLADKADDEAPYFSMMLVPGWEGGVRDRLGSPSSASDPGDPAR